MKDLLDLFASNKNVFATSQLLNKEKNIYLKGLKGSAQAVYASSIFIKSSKSFIYVLNDEESAGYFYFDLTQLLGPEDVFFFPSAYKRAIKYGQLDAANEILRTEVMNRLRLPNQKSIVVTYPEALAETIVAQEVLDKNILELKVDEEIDRAFVTEMLDAFKFEFVDYVYEPGQYAIRGSILDIFSFASEEPYRVDFFGDEIASIRPFNIETQLSNGSLKHIQIIPNLQDVNLKRDSLLNMLSAKYVLAFQDYAWAAEKIDANYHDVTILDNPEYNKNFQDKLISKEDFVKQSSSFTHLHFGNKAFGTPDATVPFSTDLQPIFHKNFDLIEENFKSFQSKGYVIYLLSDSSKQHERVKAIFDDRYGGIDFTPVLKTLSQGFVDASLKVCCYTDHQIFDRYHKYNLKSDKVRSGKFALSLKELQQFQIGDYIVHMDHGVGQFGGLIRSDINGKMQELIKLTYLNGDTIFVSIHSLHKISKYRGKENEPPRVNKLGTGAWNKMKEKTKLKVKDIARDLIKLYAQRQKEKGFSFSPDTYLQNELEASFIYEDTPDQMKVTAEVKEDMESDKPMDRLVCGDVGFGKTEIAVRAAFKAVADSKQVAVLVPTTVLAYQHYQTFKSRLKDLPCNVDYLSRARTSKQSKETLKALKDGGIDIIIGTHRLVGKDVEFKDLGLMIIDEEQKFGVSVKEKLRQFKVNIDTLTLTATPIPRTLQFSLMGARDMSTLTTPPSNRYPIQTQVHIPDPQIIKEAVEFELSRNGQVFIINNRISNIHEIENVVRREVPQARVVVGYGQMDPAKLEDIIMDFSNHEYDVLIATTIIESGIDVPNANTIIVNNAHHFGLSDLHQLRGRVGRGNRKAFAYLLAPPLHTLNPESRRRLQAIENFSELGHGIHIAMQDLDIRGAGNMLGAEQSGFIADLGYEVYQKILSEAVNELKNDEFVEIYKESEQGSTKIEGSDFVEDVQVESDLELLFPADYIPNDSERITFYRELDNITKEEEIQPFVAKLKDRFGEPPFEGKELIRVVNLRIYAKKIGIEKVYLKRQRMNLYLISNPESPYYQSKAFDRLIRYVQSNHRHCEFKENNGKRSVSIKNVVTVEQACEILKNIGEMQI